MRRSCRARLLIFDNRIDVDQSDYGLLMACHTGPNMPLVDSECRYADLNRDGMVDLADVAAMQPNLLAGATAEPPTATILYNGYNRMSEYRDEVTGKVHRYAYDVLGRRAGKIVDADGPSPQVTLYLYDGDRVIEERDAQPNGDAELQTSYVYGLYIDEVLSVTRAGSGGGGDTTHYFHYDDLYNTTTITNAAGQVLERYAYNDIGQPLFFAPDQTPRAASTIGTTRLWNNRGQSPIKLG